MSISPSKYDEIMRRYNEQRLDRRYLIEERRALVYSKIPMYKEIEDEIADISIEKAKALILSASNDDSSLDLLKDKINELHDKKLSILRDNGFPDDYLEPPYTCPDCKDTGYIDNVRCHCLTQAIIDVLYEQSNIRSILEKENFAYFTDRYYNESDKEHMLYIYNECKSYVEVFDSNPCNLLFFGNVGCGKTFLSHCIAKDLLDLGHSVIYFTAYQLFEYCAARTFGKLDEKFEASQVLKDLFECDLLIIDDLGSENRNSFTVSQLFLVLNERQQLGKATIISTNLDLQQLKDIYSERSVSRIFGGYRLYNFIGDDIRRKVRN